MKPKATYLADLNTDSRDYKVKVKVIEKRRPKTSPNKNMLYQSLLLEDEKGTRMRGALFADQVAMSEDAIHRNKTYEIRNAAISPVKPEWKRGPTDLDYQMTFGRRTLIFPLDDDTGLGTVAAQEYLPISQLPRQQEYSELFDVLGVVLFVEDQLRVVTTSNKRESRVRELLLIDHCTTQPLAISIWDELAEDACTMLIPAPGKFRLVGLTALRVSGYKGFLLSTSASTTIIHAPVGAKTEALSTWVVAHHMALSELQSRILNTKVSPQTQKATTIAAIRSKKAKSVLQDDRHWLDVTIPDADLSRMHAYLGCSHCSKRSTMPPGTAYTCYIRLLCPRLYFGATVIMHTNFYRVTFNYEISDGTGTLLMTAFTTTVSQLCMMSASDLFHMKQSENNEAFEVIRERLERRKFKVCVGPAQSLSTSNILQLVVKQVIVADDGVDTPPNNAGTPAITIQAQEGKSIVAVAEEVSEVETGSNTSATTIDNPLPETPCTT